MNDLLNGRAFHRPVFDADDRLKVVAAVAGPHRLLADADRPFRVAFVVSLCGGLNQRVNLRWSITKPGRTGCHELKSQTQAAKTSERG